MVVESGCMYAVKKILVGLRRRVKTSIADTTEKSSTIMFLQLLLEATHIIKTSYGTIFDTSEPFVFVIILLRNKLVEPFYNNSIIVVRSVKNERVKQNGNIFRIITTIAALLRQVENFRCYNLCG